MQKSEAIKEALEPTPATRSRQIFQNFTDSTVALFECADTPVKLREDFAEAILEAGNVLEAHDTPDCPCPPSAGYTLSRIFDLADPDAGEETQAARCGRALEELTQAEITLDVAEALDVIKKYERVLPESITAPLDEAIGEFNEAEDVEAHEEAARAARELAGAFAAIEQWRDYIPTNIYNPIYESLSEWIINDAQFLNNPTSLRAGLPGIFRGIFRLEEEGEAA